MKVSLKQIDRVGVSGFASPRDRANHAVDGDSTHLMVSRIADPQLACVINGHACRFVELGDVRGTIRATAVCRPRHCRYGTVLDLSDRVILRIRDVHRAER